MQIGIYWGYVAMIEGLVERMKGELGKPATVVATGGLADLFDKQTEVFDAIEPDLTIQGLSLLYDMAARSTNDPRRRADLPRARRVGRDRHERQSLRLPRPVDHGRSRPDLRRRRISRDRPHPARSRVHREPAGAAAGIVLTHGHEDHIGALPYLSEDLKAPLYATPFTAGLIAGKLEEEGLTGQVKLNIVERGGTVELGPFKVSFVALSHSIPEGNGLLIETPFGNIFHTGDWKIDETPVIGEAPSTEELTQIGDDGVLALVCDFDQRLPGSASGSEESVHAGLHAQVAKAKGRVLVTTFASNAARLQTIGRVGRETGRKVCIAGRSLDRILRVAQATGYLHDFPPPISFDEAMRLPRNEVLIIATGGQGEPRAALGRIASGTHDLKLGDGDTVIFSSRIIPGNEVAIGRIMNQLSDLGVQIVTEKQAHVHVSGHPGRPELIEMYEWVRPEIMVPVHGEARHLAEQARLALGHGVPNAVVQKNGDVIRLAPGDPKKIDEVRVGRLVLDGDVILPADGTTDQRAPPHRL